MSPSPAQVLVSGIDSLYLFSLAPIHPEVKAALAVAKTAAQEATKLRRPLPVLSFAGVRLEVQPKGTKTAPYRLTSPLLDLILSPAPPTGLPPFSIELRAVLLWQRGAVAAHQLADDLRAAVVERQPLLEAAAKAADVPGALVPGTLGVTRMDLCIDFQCDGWAPPCSPRAYTKRGRWFRPNYDGNEYLGVEIGSGGIRANIYDKTREIRSSDKGWFVPIWRDSGHFDSRLPVWRVEFQLKRAGIRSLRLGGRRLSTFGELAPATGQLWRILASKWLAIRAPRSATSRQRLDPVWDELRSSGFAGPLWNGTRENLCRIARRSAAERCQGQLNGYAARWLADESRRTGLPPNLDVLGRRLLASVHAHGERTGNPVDAKARRLKEEWEAAERVARGEEPASEPVNDEEEPHDELDS